MRTLVKGILSLLTLAFAFTGIMSWIQAGTINYLVIIAAILLLILFVAFRMLKKGQQEQSKRR